MGNFGVLTLVSRFSVHVDQEFNMLRSFAALLLLTAELAFSQTSFGRISGTVTDAAGAVVPAAKITVRNTDNQHARA